MASDPPAPTAAPATTSATAAPAENTPAPQQELVAAELDENEVRVSLSIPSYLTMRGPEEADCSHGSSDQLTVFVVLTSLKTKVIQTQLLGVTCESILLAV